MSEIIYGLCAILALGCAALLLGNYAKTRSRLILWSGLCFVGLGLNNVLLVLNFLVFPSADLSTIRLIPALIGMMLLVYGLIWECD